MAKSKMAILIIAGVTILFLGFVLSKSYTFIKEKIVSDQVTRQAMDASITEWKNALVQKLGNDQVFHLESGPADRNLQIVLVIDPICSNCAVVLNKLEALQKKGKISFKVYFYPLDSYCNPFIKFRSDGLNCQLTRNIMCAEMTAKKGLELTNRLFEQNKNIAVHLAKGPEILNQQLDQLSLDRHKMAECAVSNEAMRHNAESIASVSKLKFTQLPVLIYKNKIFNAALIDSALEELLKENP